MKGINDLTDGVARIVIAFFSLTQINAFKTLVKSYP